MPSEQYGSPVYLTLDDVDVIAKADFSDDKELEIQRDIFVFQCNVGCRIGDLLRLKKRDIINGAVEYIPTKTIKERAKTVVVPLNAMASSHMARRTFIGNIYKLVKDPNLVSALTGHVEGSRAFNRYRDIDIDMKCDLVKILEGKH